MWHRRMHAVSHESSLYRPHRVRRRTATGVGEARISVICFSACSFIKSLIDCKLTTRRKLRNTANEKIKAKTTLTAVGPIIRYVRPMSCCGASSTTLATMRCQNSLSSEALVSSVGYRQIQQRGIKYIRIWHTTIPLRSYF